ncbi:MAG: hypothetical protein AAB408_01345 [Patescibacteria group bacterium]
MAKVTLRIGIDHEDDGRVLVAVVSRGWSGVAAYGRDVAEAVRNARRLVRCIVADRCRHQERVPGLVQDGRKRLAVIFIV